jgi:hypothetical protein
MLDLTYGRIGARGRTIRHVAADEAEARKIVRHCLQRRGTAQKRIGVGYRLRELIDTAQRFTFPVLQAGLPAVAPHAARAAWADHGPDRGRHGDIAACRAYLPAQVEHPARKASSFSTRCCVPPPQSMKPCGGNHVAIPILQGLVASAQG